MHHPTDKIPHTTAFVTSVVEQWLEREIAQWVNYEGSIWQHIAPWANALTTELHLAPPIYMHIIDINTTAPHLWNKSQKMRCWAAHFRDNRKRFLQFRFRSMVNGSELLVAISDAKKLIWTYLSTWAHPSKDLALWSRILWQIPAPSLSKSAASVRLYEQIFSL